jgi:hypothetical protein
LLGNLEESFSALEAGSKSMVAQVRKSYLQTAESTVPKFLGETAGGSTNNQVVVWPVNCGFYLAYDRGTFAFSISSHTLCIVAVIIQLEARTLTLVSVYHLT